MAALERLAAGRRGPPGPGRLTAAAGLFLAALLAKETALLLPLLALLIGWHHGRRPRRPGQMLAVLALPIAVVFRDALPGDRQPAEGRARSRSPLLDNPLAALPPLERAANGALLLLRSLGLLIFPWKLSADYSLAALPTVGRRLGRRRRRRCTSGSSRSPSTAGAAPSPSPSGIATFYLGLLPTANLLFASGTIFGERFLLLPALGRGAAAAELFERAR